MATRERRRVDIPGGGLRAGLRRQLLGLPGLDGTGANGGPSLATMTDRDAVLRQVRNGGGGMPAFKGSLSETEIQDVASSVTERIAKKSG